MEPKFIGLLLEQIAMSFDAIYDAFNGDFEKIADAVYSESSCEFDAFIDELAKSSKYGLVRKEDATGLSVDELVSQLVESTGSIRDAIEAVTKRLRV